MRKLDFTLSYSSPIRAFTNCSIFVFSIQIFNIEHIDPENAFTTFALSHPRIDLNLSELLDPS